MTHVTRALVLAGLLLAPLATAAPKMPVPYGKVFLLWAEQARFTLTDPRECKGIEEAHFGARGSYCWSAKSQVEQAPRGSRMFPRLDIALATYASEAAAKVRLARFRTVPAALAGPLGKAYPLRAAFRIDARVVIVTSDAYAFVDDVYRAAAELAKAAGGTDLVCWGGGAKPCP